jgi:hypothetical protein
MVAMPEQLAAALQVIAAQFDLVHKAVDVPGVFTVSAEATACSASLAQAALQLGPLLTVDEVAALQSVLEQSRALREVPSGQRKHTDLAV